MLVRTWNVFLGNTSRRGRRTYLREMVELVTADRPAVVCLQEVPAKALKSVGDWAGMRAVPMRASGGLFGGGRGNVILVPKDVTVRETKGITLNTNPFVEEEGRKLGLDTKLVRWWEKERRVCNVAKIELPDRSRILVATLHATRADDPRLADAELNRAMRFVNRQFEVGEVAVVAGDFNLALDRSQTVAALIAAPPEDRWLANGVLVRDGTIGSVRTWPDDERTYDGKLLSDHPPVEANVERV